MATSDPTSVCLNCSAPKERTNATFCTYCGQKHGTGKISLKEIVSELISNIFNLDSKTIRTAGALLLPGKLTKEYFHGKHKSYSHPIRLFFVSAIFFFAAMSSNLWNDDSQNDLGAMFNNFIEKTATLAVMDSLKQVIVQEYEGEEARSALDSMTTKFAQTYSSGSNNSTIDLVNLEFRDDSLFLDSIYIIPKDLKSLSPNQLVEKYYSDRNFWEKGLARQGIKVLKKGGSMVDFMLSKVPLMLLVMMPFLALFLKLLYYRRNRYFVEHLFFSFHLHAFIFFVGTLVLVLKDFIPENLLGIIWLGIFVYLFWAMKSVYAQSYGKTFLKFLATLFIYLVLAAVFLMLFVVISFILF